MNFHVWVASACLVVIGCSPPPATEAVPEPEQVRQKADEGSTEKKRAAAALILEILRFNQGHSELGYRIAGTSDREERRSLIEKSNRVRDLILEYGDLLDTDAADLIYPSLGAKISGQLIASYRRAEEIIVSGDARDLSEVAELQQAFVEWLNPRREEIEVALNETLGRSR